MLPMLRFYGRSYALQPGKDRNGLSLFLWFANAHLVRETEAGEVLEKFEALQRDFCYSNAADNSVRSPEARYRWTAEHGDRIAGFLACVKVFQGVDDAQNPVFGDPIITVLQAPVVTMDGKPVVGESVWPNQLPLAPDKYPVPRDEFYPWAASVAPAWRVFSDRHLRRSRSDYLSEVVYDLDGLNSFAYGWHVTNRRGTTEQSGLPLTL
jgi:hypothetical protein